MQYLVTLHTFATQRCLAFPFQLQLQLFLNANMAAIDLMCWLEIEAFRAIPASDVLLRNVKARQLKTKFLNKKYFFGPNSPASREQQRQVSGLRDWDMHMY